MKRSPLRQIGLLLVILITIGINVLAEALPLNNQSTGAISDRYPILVTPAGYAFGIWSVIYLGLILFGFYQALPAQRTHAELARTDGWVLLSCLANASWIVLWHYNFTNLTLPVMLVLLVSLIAIVARRDPARTAAARWLVHLPFTIYLGWISVATIINVGVVLYNLGFTTLLLGPLPWAVIVLFLGALLGLTVGTQPGMLAYALVIAWAYVGIAVKQGGSSPIAWTAGTLALVVTLAALFAARPQRSAPISAKPAQPQRI